MAELETTSFSCLHGHTDVKDEPETSICLTLRGTAAASTLIPTASVHPRWVLAGCTALSASYGEAPVSQTKRKALQPWEETWAKPSHQFAPSMRPLGRLVASVLAPSSPTSRQHRSKPQQNERQSRKALEDWLVNAKSHHEVRSQIGQRAWQSSGYAPADKPSEPPWTA